jgi:cell division protein FtsL
MMRRLRDKFVALIMLIVSLFYVGYRIYETKSDAAALQVKTRRRRTYRGYCPSKAG